MKKIHIVATVSLVTASFVILVIQIFVTNNFELSIFFSIISAFFIFLGFLLLLNESSVKYHTQLFKDIFEIKNSEIRDIIFDNINLVNDNIEESKNNRITITSPNKAKDIAFKFFKTANSKTHIYSTMDFVKRKWLLNEDTINVFISSNRIATDKGADINRIFIIDSDIESNHLFIQMYNELEDIGCTLYKKNTIGVQDIVSSDFIISIDSSMGSKQKVFIGGLDKPTDEYKSVLSFDQNDIDIYMNKYNSLKDQAEND